MPLQHQEILPSSSTPWERLFAETNDPLVALAHRFDDIRAADGNPPPSFLPFLVWEYGLGELTPYLPNLYSLIREGLLWQRVRGTPAAIDRGLSWLGYTGELEEEAPRRRRWNRFQVELDRVRDVDLPDLRRIDGIVGLSPPERSKFARGFHGYDIRAGLTSGTRTSACLTSDHSGVFVEDIRAKWSFGREYEADTTLSEAELTALDAWIEPVPEGDLWVDGDYLWADADFDWNVPAVQSRRNAIAGALAALPAWITFRTSANAVIGHARAIVRPVAQAVGGEYAFGSARWTASTEAPAAVAVLARSGFGDAAGQVAAKVSVTFDATLTDATRPGRLWLPPSGLSGGHRLAETMITVPFGLTVREGVRFLLRF